MEKKHRGEFAITGVFHNNHYGYAQDVFVTHSKNLVVNTWPALVPEFQHLKNVSFLGLTILPTDIELLKRRMDMRGDPFEKIQERLALIKKDMVDLVTIRKIIQKRGKLFTIIDNCTISDSLYLG